MESYIGFRTGKTVATSEWYWVQYPTYKTKRIKVKCDCGSDEREVSFSSLINNKVLACKCAQVQAMKSKMRSHVGEVWNRLTVVGDAFERIKSKRIVTVQCSCGSEPFRTSYTLISGKDPQTKSCGCLYKETRGPKTHGMAGTVLYTRWQAMKQRCNNPNTSFFDIYGGRGITYCEEWETFENFYADMGDSFFEGADLDRIDFNGNYCKGNCRWVDKTTGNHNKGKDITRATSEYIGVFFDKRRGKYIATIKKDKVRLMYRYFTDEYQAALAYDNASEIHYGDRPNKTQKE